MTQITFTDNVLVDGSQDIEQLRVQGHSTQNDALQTWEDSAGDVLAQVTGDGRVLVGDDVGLTSPDALIEAHRADTSTTKPKRGFHSLGQVSGTLATLVQWIIGELELRGSNAIDALHTALHIRATNLNTGTPTANAELRAADVEVVNDSAAGTAALTKATGLQVAVTNASGKTITDAAALRLKLNNAGTITNPYAIYSEGPGVTHLEDYVEVKRPTSVPGTPATDFMRVYPKSDGKLYTKNWSGTEYDLTAAINGTLTDVTLAGSVRMPIGTGALAATEGNFGYETATERVRVYDGQRSRAVSSVGWCPYAYPINFVGNAAFTTALALAANGGSIAIPILVSAHMLLESVSVRNTDTATARTWGWDLYEQNLNNGNAGENTLTRVAACNANESFTPAGAASTRTLSVGSAPVYLAPGLYWLVVQSRHATSTFGVGSTASSAAFAVNIAQTKTTSNPNGSTLDLVAATWTKTTAIYAVRLNGRVFGQTTAF